jgi:hypothetical protein
MAKYFEIFTDRNFFEVLRHKKFPDVIANSLVVTITNPTKYKNWACWLELFLLYKMSEILMFIFNIILLGIR